MADPNCIFCRIAQGDIPAEKLFDDGTVFAIRDINPKAPTHVLVIPYEHVEALAEADGALVGAAAHCLEVAPRIARELGVAGAGYRLVANQGPDSGQEVPHFHLHILAGRRLGPMG
ncbi:MAG: histidine triad nucleotide-binding protein [Chloroflexi bacterium]|nr:histidine triad nucleotide-binding protein [Chloroflexota bacterium]